MTGPLPHLMAAGDGTQILHHLLTDFLLKGLIVAIALIVLAVGMVIIWRLAGRPRDHDHRR